MSNRTIPEEQWTKIYQFLQDTPSVYAGDEAHCRRFIEAVLWMARSGAQWRLLPEQYGHWNSVYKRFAQWCARKIWQKMPHHVADDPDLEHWIIDSPITRAHPCAAGALKKTADRLSKPWGAAEAVSVPKSTGASMRWATHYVFCSLVNTALPSRKPPPGSPRAILIG